MRPAGQQEMVDARRRLILQTRTIMEHDRCGPDLKARCGCVFLPWRHPSDLGSKSGVGLIEECDQAQRLFELAIHPPHQTAQWETHVFLAREDAENKLEEIIRLLRTQRPRLTRVDRP